MSLVVTCLVIAVELRPNSVARDFGGGLASAIRTTPRFTSQGTPAPKSLPLPLNLTQDIDFMIFRPYAEGVVILSAIPFLFAILSIPMLVFMCICCGCCNRCVPKRVPDKRVIGALITCIGLVMFVNLIIGIGTQRGIVESASGVKKVGANAAGFARNILQVGNNTLDDVVDVIDLVMDLNQTIFEVLPDSNDFDNYVGCLQDILQVVLNLSNVLETELAGIPLRVKEIIFYQNLTVLGQDVLNIIDSASFTQDISTLLIGLNNSISDLDSTFSAVAVQIDLVNSTLIRISSQDLPALREAIGEFDDLATNFEQTVKIPYLNFSARLDRFDYLPVMVARYEDPRAALEKSQVMSDLTTLRNDLTLLPSPNDTYDLIDSIQSRVVSFNTTIHGNSSSIGLIGRIDSILGGMNLLKNLSSLNDTLEDFKAFTSQSFPLDEISRIAGNLSSTLTSTRNLFPLVRNLARSINQSLVDLSAPGTGSFFDDIDSIISNFNSSLPTVFCADQVLDKIREINSTLVILPSGFNDYIQMYYDRTRGGNANVTSIYDFVTQAQDAAQDARDQVRNMTSIGIDDLISQLDTFESTLNNSYDFDEFIQEIRDSSDKIEHLRNFSRYSLSDVFDSADLEPLIVDLKNTLFSVSGAMSGFSFSDQFDFLDELDNVTHSLSDALNVSIDVLSMYPNDPLPASGTDSLIDGIFAQLVPRLRSLVNLLQSPARIDFKNNIDSTLSVISTGVNVTSLRQDVDTLLETIEDAPRFQTILDNFRTFQNSLNNLPSIDSFLNDVEKIDVKMSDLRTQINSTFESIDEYLDLVNDLPLNDTLQLIDDVVNQFTDINGTIISALKQAEDAYSNLDVMEEAKTKVFDVLAQVEETIERVDSNITQYNNLADQYVDSTQQYQRMTGAAAVLLGLFPLVVLTGMSIGYRFKLSMCVSCSFCCFSLFLPFYFIFSVPFVLVTTLLTDHCPNMKSIVLAQALSMQDFNNTKLPGNFSVPVLLSYYTTCQGSDPQVVDTLLQTFGVEDRINEVKDRYNLTELIDKFESRATYRNESFRLHPNIESDLVEIYDGVFDLVDQIPESVKQVFECNNVKSLIDSVINIPCGFVLSSLASFGVLFLVGAATICCGTCTSCYMRNGLKADQDTDSFDVRAEQVEVQVVAVDPEDEGQSQDHPRPQKIQVYEGQDQDQKTARSPKALTIIAAPPECSQDSMSTSPK